MDPLYVECRDALLRAGARASFAETHGVLCGRLCAPPGAGGGGGFEELLGDERTDPRDLQSCRELLATCLERSARELASGEFGFTPLLPDDDDTLAERCIALGDWCGGFLYGLGTGGMPGFETLSPEVREAVADLGQLARLADATEEPGGEERDYAELVEYVRVAVMHVYEEVSRGGPGAEG